VFYEFFGTLFFGYGVVTGLNGNFAYNSFFSGLFSSVWIPLCFFMMICYAGRFTKAHLNPAVTLAFMIKKQERVPFFKGLIYWAAQFTGAIVGTGIGK
jgi:aquaporin PIP